jgi:hypothetical protein
MKNINYSDIIIKTLQDSLTQNIKMHQINEHFIMEIMYEAILDSIVDDLDKAGYTIINKQQ